MIKFGSDETQYKNALTREPNTAEFERLRNARADAKQCRLLDEASNAICDLVDRLSAAAAMKGTSPEELYDKVREPTFCVRWEDAFGDDDEGRSLFGLVAWTFFFDYGGTWLATVPDSSGQGKWSWTYKTESKGKGPKFQVGQCVQRKSGGPCGRVIEGPDPTDSFFVRFPRRFDEREWPAEWIADRDLYFASDGSCEGIPANP